MFMRTDGQASGSGNYINRRGWGWLRPVGVIVVIAVLLTMTYRYFRGQPSMPSPGPGQAGGNADPP